MVAAEAAVPGVFEQDSGDRTAITSRLADHIEKREGGQGAKMERQGQQHGDRRRRREAGQRARDNSDERREKHEAQRFYV